MRQGAFTTQPEQQDLGPTEGPTDFLAKLQGMMGEPAPSVSRETAPPALEGLSALARMTQDRPRTAPRMDDPAPVPAGFLPGKPGAPKSGMTIHQIMRDPDVLTTVQDVVSEFERTNPGRALKGTHIQAGLTAKGLEVSSAQAAKIAKRIKDEADRMAEDKIAAYGAKAAKKVMG